VIKTLSKNRLKFYQKLKQKKYRDQEDLYLISGLRAVQLALENDADKCVEIIIDESKTDHLLELDTGHFKEISSVSTKDFKALSDEKSPQGICLISKKPSTIFNSEALHKGRIIFLDRINDPGNLGTIIRSTAWFGIKDILLSSNSTDPFQPKVVRSSAGAINSIHIYENIDVDRIIEIKTKGYKLYATALKDGQDLSLIHFEDKALFMFGSEANGLAKEYENLCDEKIVIKKTGSGESLNLANAVSIVMYQSSQGAK
jgi:TrmH family RNA methyltransferase